LEWCSYSRAKSHSSAYPHGLAGKSSRPPSRYIEAAVQGVLITSIYLPNGNPQPGPKFDYKLAWFERLNVCVQPDESRDCGGSPKLRTELPAPQPCEEHDDVGSRCGCSSLVAARLMARQATATERGNCLTNGKIRSVAPYRFSELIRWRYATRRENLSGELKKIFPRRLRSAPVLCHSLIRRLVV
jgi:hypothetical protein